jgi:hypothetical protein
MAVSDRQSFPSNRNPAASTVTRYSLPLNVRVSTPPGAGSRGSRVPRGAAVFGALRVSERFEPAATAALLVEAGRHLDADADAPMLLVDAGVENLNGAVDELVDAGRLRRVLARVDVTFSNSMIEAFWRSLKHGWLFLNRLDTVAAVHRLVAFYVAEHNGTIPHSALSGRTPDEVCFGTGVHVPAQLAAARSAARQRRLERNRAARCGVCCA